MDLQVKKLKVDISATPEKTHWSLSSSSFPQLKEKTKETYSQMYCFKPTFLKH